MPQPIKILHVEDSKPDLELIAQSLKNGGVDCEIQQVDTRPRLIEALERTEYDLILSDCSLPQFSGHTALQIARAVKPHIPFIFVSGTMGEETAIESLRHGATDYILKSQLARLVPAVERALNDAKERSLLQSIQRRLHQARRMEAIGTLAGGLAHDFNNLLTVIKAHLSLLAIRTNTPDQIATIVEKLNRTADRGTELTKELLIFGRKAEAQPVLVQVTNRVTETVTILKEALPKNVDLVLQLEQTLPPIFVDVSHMDRVLTNLIMNASDAMPEGGTITVTAEVVEFAPAIRSAKQADEVPYLCLKVSDTGTGMDEATRSRAFEPFYTTKAMGKGTGLGLSVVFGLMQIHNGLISLQSEVGKGTTISLFFPLHQNTALAPGTVRQISEI